MTEKLLKESDRRSLSIVFINHVMILDSSFKNLKESDLSLSKVFTNDKGFFFKKLKERSL